MDKNILIKKLPNIKSGNKISHAITVEKCTSSVIKVRLKGHIEGVLNINNCNYEIREFLTTKISHTKKNCNLFTQIDLVQDYAIKGVGAAKNRRLHHLLRVWRWDGQREGGKTCGKTEHV